MRRSIRPSAGANHGPAVADFGIPAGNCDGAKDVQFGRNRLSGVRLCQQDPSTRLTSARGRAIEG